MILRFAPLIAALAIAALAPQAAPAAVATVHIKDFKFVPATLTVTPGSTVTFVNDDAEPHTATAVDKSFDSEALDTHESWKHTFARAGTFAYFCEMHPMMKAVLIVKVAQ